MKNQHLLHKKPLGFSPHIRGFIAPLIMLFWVCGMGGGNRLLAQTPVDYWNFNTATAVNSGTGYSVNNTVYNGGPLTIGFQPTPPPPPAPGFPPPSNPPNPSWSYTTTPGTTVNPWISLANLGSNTGQLSFPLGSKEGSNVIAITSGTNVWNVNSSPWYNGTSPVREATLEFLMKPYGLQRSLLINTAFGQFVWGYSGMSFSSKLKSAGNIESSILFDNVGPLSPKYYFDNSMGATANGNWHHIALTVKTEDVYDASSTNELVLARICFYVDGLKVKEEVLKTQTPTSTHDGSSFKNIQQRVNGSTSIKIGESKSIVAVSGEIIYDHYPSAYYFEGALDEIALYNVVVLPSVIYEHYTQVINASTHSLISSGTYSFTSPGSATPSVFQPATEFDPKDIVPPAIYESNEIKKQLINIPLPRYKPDHSMLRNTTFAIFNPDRYSAIHGKGYNSNDNYNNLNRELATKWNYYITANQAASNTDFGDGVRQLAHDYPTIPISYSFAADLKAGTTCDTYDQTDCNTFVCKNNTPLSSPIYRPNSNLTTAANGIADWEDMGTRVNHLIEAYWNKSKIKFDSVTCIPILDSVTEKFDRPFDLIIDNNEVSEILMTSRFYYSRAGYPWKNTNTAVYNNSQIDADYNSWVAPAGTYKNWFRFEGINRYLRYKAPYKNRVLTSNSAINANTVFTSYEWDGFVDYESMRSYAGRVHHNSKYNVTYTYNSFRNYLLSPQYLYRIAGYVPREALSEALNPSHWIPTTPNPISDKYFIPWTSFSSYGLDAKETHAEVVEADKKAIRPATALGYSKYLSVLGAEAHTLYYGKVGATVNVPNATDNPNAVLWQFLIPSYAQAITSRYESIFRGGDVMEGDLTSTPYVSYPTSGYGTTAIPQKIKDLDANTPSTPVNTHTKYTFDTHDNRIFVGVRKQADNVDNGKNRYVIATTFMEYGNNVITDGNGNVIERNSPLDPITTEFNLESNLRVKINTRRQGSVYIFDQTGSQPVFYQLDKWHQSEHPYYWSKNFYFEAELYDNAQHGSKIVSFYTLSNGVYDFTNSMSAIRFNSTTTAPTEYRFEPRTEVLPDQAVGPSKTYMIKVNLKKVNASLQGPIGLRFYLDNSQTPVAELPTVSNSSTFSWYCAGYITVNSNVEHVLKVMPFIGGTVVSQNIGNLYIDAIELVDYSFKAQKSTVSGSCSSYDFDATVTGGCSLGAITYTWDFGDISSVNNTAYGPTPNHVFSGYDNYIVKCTINDGTKTFDIIQNISTIDDLEFDFGITDVGNPTNYPPTNPLNPKASYTFEPIFSTCLQNADDGVLNSKIKWRWDFKAVLPTGALFSNAHSNTYLTPPAGTAPNPGNLPLGCNPPIHGDILFDPSSGNNPHTTFTDITYANPPYGDYSPSGQAYSWSLNKDASGNTSYPFNGIHHVFDYTHYTSTNGVCNIPVVVKDFYVILSALDKSSGKVLKAVAKKIDTQTGIPTDVSRLSNSEEEHPKSEPSLVKANSFDLGLAPNPTDGESKLLIRLSEAKELTVSLTDIQGKVIWETVKSVEGGYQEMQIPSQQLSQGMYFVRVKIGNDVQTLKLIKE